MAAMNRPARNTLLGCAVCLILAGLYVCAAKAMTNTSSGNFMLAHCEHATLDHYPNDPLDGLCLGVVSALMFFDRELPGNAKFCPPEDVTVTQAARIAVQYMRDNPTFLHLDFRGLIATALHQAWPCK